MEGLHTEDPIRIEQLKRKIHKQIALGKASPKQLEVYNRWLKEHPAIHKQEGYIPYRDGKRGVRRKRFCDKNQQQFAFSYFKEKKGLDCEYPTIFNGKRVMGFDENHRPIGEGGIDLIDNYWESVQGGFTIFGDNLNGLKKWAQKIMRG